VPALAARRTWLIAAVLLALIVAVLFGGRAAWRLGRRLAGPPPPPRQTDVSLIADWMSVPFISRGYRVPEPELFEALGTAPEGHRMRPLREIAQETGRSPDEVVEIVRQTVTNWQSEHTGPPPGGPGPGRSGDGPRPDRPGSAPPTGPP
jgi:hypothetical protein